MTVQPRTDSFDFLATAKALLPYGTGKPTLSVPRTMAPVIEAMQARRR